MSSNRPISRRQLLDLVLCTTVLMVAYAGRGWLLASWLGGTYPLASLIGDVLALAALVLLLRAVDAGVAGGLRRLVGTRTRCRRVGVGMLRFGLVFAVAAPLLVTLSQLHPQRIVPAVDPGQLGVPCEDIWLEAGGQHLSAWHLHQDRAGRPPVLILHGVGSNKQNFLGLGRMLAEAGHPVLLLDFRAHGSSTGTITTLGYREAEDVKAAHDWMAQRYPGRPLCVVGHSMGAAAAVRAAATYGIFDRLVLDSCFCRVENSVRHAAAQWLLPPPLPAAWWHLMRGWARVLAGIDLDRLRPEEDMAGLADRRVLLIHGTADATTPFAGSVRLQECTQGKALLWLVEGAGHLQAVAHPEYASRLQRFLGEE